jgi:plastocyanin
MRRFMTSAVAAALAITASFSSPSLASTPNTWHVQGGSIAFDASGPSGGGNRFYPSEVSIHAGDNIVFSPIGPHTVTFNRPPLPLFALFAPINATPTAGTISSPSVPVSSGFIGTAPGDTYTLTFAATLSPGRYFVICGLHLGMTETINVLPSSAALPKTDAQYTAIAQREIARDLATTAEIASDGLENDEDGGEDEDGAPTVFVGLGNHRVTNLRFFPQSITVHVGQTVRFLKTKDPTEPHTVTFGAEPADPIAQLMARGGSTYSGTEDLSSGFMSTRAQFAFYHLAGLPLPVALTRYRLTFTRVGDFQYFCAIHDEVGMRGIVHVVR